MNETKVSENCGSHSSTHNRRKMGKRKGSNYQKPTTRTDIDTCMEDEAPQFASVKKEEATFVHFSCCKEKSMAKRFFLIAIVAAHFVAIYKILQNISNKYTVEV